MTNGLNKKVLVIEDDNLMSKALAKKLELSGYVPQVARDGKEGLEKAFGEKPDLILLDIIMPVMDGLTFLEKLREDEWGKTVPVIILSNLTSVSDAYALKEKGVSEYLIKTDWKLDEVVEKISEELEIK
jgi:two-component system, OmpR family, alkaline phosphatase synthesis response regulator PhoP